jgi:hypothetical protein
MSEAVVTWAALGGAVLALLTIITFWTRYSDRITRAETEAEAAKTSAQAASILAAALGAKLENQQQAFSDYRESAALKFVSNHDMVQAEGRFSDLAEQIKCDIRGVTERLDRVLERRAGGE